MLEYQINEHLSIPIIFNLVIVFVIWYHIRYVKAPKHVSLVHIIDQLDKIDKKIEILINNG